MESVAGLDEDMNLWLRRWFKVDMVAMVSGISIKVLHIVLMSDTNPFPPARIRRKQYLLMDYSMVSLP